MKAFVALSFTRGQLTALGTNFKVQKNVKYRFWGLSLGVPAEKSRLGFKAGHPKIWTAGDANSHDLN